MHIVSQYASLPLHTVSRSNTSTHPIDEPRTSARCTLGFVPSQKWKVTMAICYRQHLQQLNFYDVQISATVTSRHPWTSPRIITLPDSHVPEGNWYNPSVTPRMTENELSHCCQSRCVTGWITLIESVDFKFQVNCVYLFKFHVSALETAEVLPDAHVPKVGK